MPVVNPVQDVVKPMYKKLIHYIKEIKEAGLEIPKERNEKLSQIAEFIRSKTAATKTARLIFICTHNSRRSHFCQIWAEFFVRYLGLQGIQTFSGGTEVTAFNPNAVAAIERVGFRVENPKGENPHYKVYSADDKEPIICFSKRFDDPQNPKEDFIAVMTCSDADRNCPFIPGASKRFSIPFQDPKESDGSPHQVQTYDERCREIAIQMYYLMQQVG